MSKKVKKKRKSFPKAYLISFVVFFLIGMVGGYLSTYFLTKNDTFELLGEKNLVLKLNDEYKEAGYKTILYGKDFSSKVEIESNLNSAEIGEYYITYTIKGVFGYNNLKKVRYIEVISEDDKL